MARLGVTNGTVQKCDILVIPDLVLGEGEAMRRREFIALIGAVACPLSARAQQTGVPIVGFLGTVAQPAWTKLVAAFDSSCAKGVTRTRDIMEKVQHLSGSQQA